MDVINPMYALHTNKDLCKHCWVCDRILPGFKMRHNGFLLIANTRLEEEEVKESISVLTSKCPNNAIYLAPFIK